MRSSRLITLLIFFAAFFLACGRKGPLLPPLVRIPGDVKEATVFQRGNKIFLEWNMPVTYSDGSPIQKIQEMEVWFFSGDKEVYDSPLSLDQFKKEANLLKVIKEGEFSQCCFENEEKKERCSFIYPLEKEESFEQSFTFSLKIKDERGKTSSFSSLLFIIPKILLLPPENVDVEVIPKGLSLTWEPPSGSLDGSPPPEVAGYNIYRKEKEEESWKKVNDKLNKGTSYVDENVQFGQEYYYAVRASVSSKSPYEESENSKEVKIVPQDIFPPLPPEGLTAVATTDSVSLSWSPGSDSELAGFRVWRRKEGNKEFQCLTLEPFSEIVYEDRKAEKDTLYFYAVTAVDMAGNESEKSNEVSVLVRKEKHEDLPV